MYNFFVLNPNELFDSERRVTISNEPSLKISIVTLATTELTSSQKQTVQTLCNVEKKQFVTGTVHELQTGFDH